MRPLLALGGVQIKDIFVILAFIHPRARIICKSFPNDITGSGFLEMIPSSVEPKKFLLNFLLGPRWPGLVKPDSDF
jgi:hypothetical protein